MNNRFELALEAELNLMTEEIEVLRSKARTWIVRSEVYHQDGDDDRSTQALVFATAFSEVADARQESLLAR